MWGKGNGSVPQNLLEESVRVPLIVQWPDEAVAPQVRREFVDHCDGFLTVLDAAGVEPPADREFPGRSYRHLVTEAADATDWEQVQIFEYADVDGVRTEDYKLVRQPTQGRELLFDLANDPRETRNVLEDGYASVADRLRERLDEALEEYGDPASRRAVDSLPDHGAGEVWNR
jgi:arylsulfatase A-like enzyme